MSLKHPDSLATMKIYLLRSLLLRSLTQVRIQQSYFDTSLFEIYYYIDSALQARISSDLNRPTIGCASFGMSLGMSPKSTKKPKSIPRFNTTGNLLLQPSTPATSPASTFKAPSTAKKRLPSSQSSNALPVLQRSRIPTPIRAQESSIATYTYSWAKTTPIKTETGTKHVHRYEPALSGIGIPSEPSKSPAKISLVPKSQTQNDVVLPVKKAFQVQCQPVMNKDGAETSSIGQASWSSRKRTAGPSQIIDPEHEASASASVPVFSRPSLPLKAQSSQNLLGQRPCRETVTRAFSGGITHFSSVITVDPKHVEYARGISRGVTLKNLGNSSSQNEMAEMQRKINEVRRKVVMLSFQSVALDVFFVDFTKFYIILFVIECIF